MVRCGGVSAGVEGGWGGGDVHRGLRILGVGILLFLL